MKIILLAALNMWWGQERLWWWRIGGLRGRLTGSGGCGNISGLLISLIEGRGWTWGQRLFLFLKTAVLSDLPTRMCLISTFYWLFFVLPPTPSSDFFVISFTDWACQKTCQNHAHYVNEGGTQYCHAYFCFILQDEVNHESITALQRKKYRVSRQLVLTFDFNSWLFWLPYQKNLICNLNPNGLT